MDEDCQKNVVSFVVSDNLRKPITLPSKKMWRVHEEDSLASGNLLCFTKIKGLLFNRISSLVYRTMTVTKHGFLIIYDEDNKGFVLDVRAAKSLKTRTDSVKSKKDNFRRCHFKLKFTFGTIHIIALNENIAPWKQALADVHDGLVANRLFNESNCTSTKVELTSELSSTHDITSTTTAKELVDPEEVSVEFPLDFTLPLQSKVESTTTDSFEEPTVIPKPFTPVAVSQTIDSSNSGLISELEDPSTDETMKSIRSGYKSVAILRKRLENKFKPMVDSRRERNKTIKIELPKKELPKVRRSRSCPELSTSSMAPSFTLASTSQVSPKAMKLMKSGYDNWNTSERA